MSRYVSDQVQRVLKTIELMAGNEINGVEPKQLAQELKTSPADVTRILSNLEHAGWAERLPGNDKRWRLHKKPVQLSNTVDYNFKNALRNMQNDFNNYNVMG